MLESSLQTTTSAGEVWAALAWGAVSSVGLLVGAIAGSFSRMPHRAIAMAMSVGAGLLLAGVSLKVAADAIRMAGPFAAALSLLLGAAMFSASNALLARFGAAHRKRCGECVQQPAESQQPGSGVAIALGNALDAVPEGMVLGVALRRAPSPSGERWRRRQGMSGFSSLSAAWPSRVEAFGAGALLAMTAETMIPEAVDDSPRFSGLLAALGFGLLLLVDAATR